MKANINEIAFDLKKLIEFESSEERKLGRCGLDIIIHDKSKNINAGSIEVKLSIYDNEKSEYPMDIIRCSIIVVEKTTVNQTTGDEFTRTCSIVMNDISHDILWNKMSRDSTKAAVEYCFGYLLNNTLMVRGKKPMKNISGYVKDTVSTMDNTHKIQTELN